MVYNIQEDITLYIAGLSQKYLALKSGQWTVGSGQPMCNFNFSDLTMLATCTEDFLSLETYTARNPTHIDLNLFANLQQILKMCTIIGPLKGQIS